MLRCLHSGGRRSGFFFIPPLCDGVYLLSKNIFINTFSMFVDNEWVQEFFFSNYQLPASSAAISTFVQCGSFLFFMPGWAPFCVLKHYLRMFKKKRLECSATNDDKKYARWVECHPLSLYIAPFWKARAFFSLCSLRVQHKYNHIYG